jgi:cytochrome P450
MSDPSPIAAHPLLRPVSIGNAIVDEALHADPGAYHALLTELRETDPVCWVEPDEYAPFWIVSRHADIQEVELAKDVFVNAPRSLLRRKTLDAQIEKLTGGRPFLLNTLVNMDGAEHLGHRKLTQAWFMPGRLKAIETALRGYSRTYVDRMLATGGECDFMRDVASWYPLRTIMHILGVPEEDEARMLQLTQQIFGPDDPDIRTEKVDIVSTVQGFFDYFGALIDRRKDEPADDVATIIANAEVAREPIGRQEALSYFILIATAGHDTTSSTIAGGLLALIENPDELATLRADMRLLPNATDEMVRWVSPVTHFFRTATQDYELRGRRISAGQSLMMCYPSANRDADAFEDPFRFDVTRKAGRHLAFGYGPHVCLGQHLAKLELRIFFEELLSRVEGFELAGEPAWVRSNFVGGLKRLPIRFRPRGDDGVRMAA